MDTSASAGPRACEVPRVILVTDGRRLAPDGRAADRVAALVAQARGAFAAGVDAVQIREPDLDGGALYELTRAIAALGPAIVTARADIAIAAGAAGVHLKADGPDARRVRALLPPRMTLSRAVHGPSEAARHAAGGAIDWFLAGTAFETASKPGREPLGEAGLRAIARASMVPIVAIGGITSETAALARAAGAAGVAAIGLFLREIEPEHVDRLRVRSLE